jgi:2-amino-4-ketopentanoate thiolase beta subunit
MDNEQVIVVQETEYTGAGKHPMSQLTFAKQNGVDVRVGNPEDEIPGQNIIIPSHPSLIKVKEVDLDRLRKSYIKNCIDNYKVQNITINDVEFLAKDIKKDQSYVMDVLKDSGITII